MNGAPLMSGPPAGVKRSGRHDSDEEVVTHAAKVRVMNAQAGGEWRVMSGHSPEGISVAFELL